MLVRGVGEMGWAVVHKKGRVGERAWVTGV